MIRIPTHGKPTRPGKMRDCTEHPRSAPCVVEISESSLSYDCSDKADLYAAGGIRDFCVVDLSHRHAVAHRDPVSDPVRLHGARYQNVTKVGADAQRSPLAAPGKANAVVELLS